jgi:hypothetical protein
MNRWMLALSIGATALAFEHAAFADGDQPPVVQGNGDVKAGVGVDANGGANGGTGGATGGAAGGVGANGQAAGGGGIEGMHAPGPEVDGVRFRGGIALDAGAFVFPGGVIPAVGLVGLQGTTGVQINNLVGIYVVPGFDIIFGDVGGVGLTAALMVDFTINHLFTVGVGPDVGAFAAIGVDAAATQGAAIGGANYGARLHFAVHPVVGHSGVHRQAFTIGLDMRFLGGPSGQVAESGSGSSTSVSADGFIFSPYLTLGYSAF